MTARWPGAFPKVLLTLATIALVLTGERTPPSAQKLALCAGADVSGPRQLPGPQAAIPVNRSWVGDAGHFLKTSTPRIFVNNPDGESFTVTVHQHLWKANVTSRVSSIKVQTPDGCTMAAGSVGVGEASTTVTVPGGVRGVYAIEMVTTGYSLTWVETSLSGMVAQAEPFDEVGSHAFQLHAMVPRRWYFYVPPGTKTFYVRHVIQLSQSHREDFGLFVMNPRGQRVEAVFGGKSLDMRPTLGSQRGVEQPPMPVAITRKIEVDPGTAGRFWSLMVTGGDSHSYSDLVVQLGEIPPYLAPSPEQWFDPSTGKSGGGPLYDETVIRHPDEQDSNGVAREAIPRYYNAPAPFLGDEGYNGWRGPHTLWLNNPDNRRIEFGVQTYLASADERNRNLSFQVIGPSGTVVLNQKLTLDGSVVIPARGAGVYRISVDGSRWFPWTHPALPIVLEGQPSGAAGTRFRLETGIARHWFFRVPTAIRTFTIAAHVHDPDQVLRLEVHAPDRMMEEMSVRGGAAREMVVIVPPNLAGRSWFLRTEIGSATRFVTTNGQPRQLTIDADLELRGVPGYLAPTWEQGFDPRTAASGTIRREP